MGHSSELTVNLIPLGGKTKMQVHCHYEKRGMDDIPLKTSELPPEISKKCGGSTLYTDLTDKDPDISLEVLLDEAPHFAKRVLNHRLAQWFRDRKEIRIIRTDMDGNLELCLLKQKVRKKDTGVFECYKIQGSFGRLTDGFECTVIYDGIKQVWLRPVYEYAGEATDIRTVAYKRSLYSYQRLMEAGMADRNEVYPVINYKIRNVLGLPDYHQKPENMIRHYTERLDWFYETFIRLQSFREEFRPDRRGYVSIPENRTRRLPLSSADLVFGDGVITRSPIEGMRRGGPFKPPQIAYIELFMILHEQSVKTLGDRLYKYLKGGNESFPGLPTFARMPVHFRDRPLTFRNRENPLPEIRKSLQKMDLDERIRYGAIYISPISVYDSDPDRHAVYYRVKEELLKYGITSQTIQEESILGTSFQKYLPNIATALVAKMGGQPWMLKQESANELVIGIGIYRPDERLKRYLGSTFSFTRNGSFRGFDCYTADDDLKLIGSILKAVREFRRIERKTKRVVIHLHKKMRRNESEELFRKIRKLKLNIPLVILTIQKTSSNDLVLSDRSVSHRLPLSGTWTQIGKRHFLLCNNTRYGLSDDEIRTYPFPLKVRIDIADNQHRKEKWNDYMERLNKKFKEEGWIEELLRQVYQFSRLDWQSMSVNTTPVTIKYPERVAKRFPYFRSATLPEFGKKNLWFL